MKLALSITASWAWGTSLIVGMQIAQQKGLGAWGIWALANCFTLVLFGWLTRSGFLKKGFFSNKLLKACAIGIQLICLVVNLNILNLVATDLGVDSVTAYVFATVTGLIFVLWMYPHGLKTSIWTDKWQAMLTACVLVGIIALGLQEDTPLREHPISTLSDIEWALYSSLILLSGPIGDLMHYQRADVAKSNEYTVAGGFFAIYLGLVLCMSYLTFTPAMNVLLLLAVIGVTSSTIDSIAVALHEMVNKNIGTAVGCGVCVGWGLVSQMGIIELWSRAGAFRILFALVLLGIGWLAWRNSKCIE